MVASYTKTLKTWKILLLLKFAVAKLTGRFIDKIIQTVPIDKNVSALAKNNQVFERNNFL